MAVDRGGLTRHAAKNRAWWDSDSDDYQQRHGDQIARGLAWGVWQVPEDELQVLGDVEGLDTLDFNSAGMEVVDLIEIRAPKEGESTYDYVPREWARRWPAENIWKARKRL